MPEGQQLTEEDLKNMSPEQIQELQKQNCIFCKIIKGEIPAKKIFEDDVCVAVLDINPANPGHLLLMPKEHAPVMPMLKDDVVSHLGIVAKKLTQACIKALKVEGVSCFVANGAVAGQLAPHFMMHIIPRKENDGLSVLDLPEKKIPEDQINQLADMLIPKINKAFGIETKTPSNKSEKGLENSKNSQTEEKGLEKKSEEPETETKPEKESEPSNKSEKGLENPEDSQRVEIEKPKKTKVEEKKEPKKQSKPKKGNEIDLDKIAKMFG